MSTIQSAFDWNRHSQWGGGGGGELNFKTHLTSSRWLGQDMLFKESETRTTANF